MMSDETRVKSRKDQYLWSKRPDKNNITYTDGDR